MSYRIECDGDYMIIAPNPSGGYYHSLTERTYLVDNLLSFLKRHQDINVHQVTVYELREINVEKPRATLAGYGSG